MLELKINVIGMECAGCENRLKNALYNLKEIEKVEASYKTGEVIIKTKSPLDDALKNKIITSIENLDFKVVM